MTTEKRLSNFTFEITIGIVILILGAMIVWASTS